MYRTSEEYDRMAMLAISILVDYGIKDFPLDMDYLCKRMNINLIPYSAYDGREQALLALSKDGFNTKKIAGNNATIFFNDKYGNVTPERISQTKGHELKHILEDDSDDSEDDLSDYFGKYLRCPIPLLIYLNIEGTLDIMSRFGTSSEQTQYIIKGLKNRKRKYGNAIFSYEVELLESVLGNKLDLSDITIID